MIQINNGTLHFQDRTIFDDFNVTIQPRDRIAILGRNGAGKSTLLKIIAGYAQFDEGSVSIGKNFTIGYLPQEIPLNSTKSVIDETLSIFDYFIELEKTSAQLEQELSQNPDNALELSEKYSSALEQLAKFDKSAAHARAVNILKGLGFSDIKCNQTVNELSEGWKMRVVLAKLLLQDADFYLFDEPTNHLDLPSKEWFFNFLKNSSFGFMLVTHDRYFLEHACTTMMEIEQGDTTWFNGSFSEYVTFKERKQNETQKAYERQQKEIAKKQATIERFRASASKARMAQSMIKQLDRIERIEPIATLPTISLTFRPLERSGNIVLTVSHLAQQFGNTRIFEDISFEITRGQKVALIAANGVGKSTVLNAITGKLPAQSGTVTFGHNVSWAYFEQDQAKVLRPTNTVLQEVLDACPSIPESTIRAFLGTFLFSGDDVYKKISVLSGGERNRVAMVKALLQDANFLILDEPTNHLDVYAQEVVLQALQQYKGTLLFVSHDHNFLQNLATDIIELTPHRAYLYHGSYENYLLQKSQTESKSAPSVMIHESKKPYEQQSGKEAHELRKKVNALERTISKKESELKNLAEKISFYAHGSRQYNELLATMSALQQEIDTATKEWESLA